MNLDDIDPTVIVARGEYATVNGEYKTTMSILQRHVQQACDELRHALQNDADRLDTIDVVSELLSEIRKTAVIAKELKAQKDDLWNSAWGVNK